MGDNFLGAVLHEGLMIRSCQGWGSFANTFFIFPIMKGYTLEDKALTKILELFLLEINS